MKRHIFGISALMFCLLARPGLPQAADIPQTPPPDFAKTCPAPQLHAALKATDTITGWKDLHQLYKSYKSCDTGAVKANFAYNISILLINRWDTILDLARESDQDKDFGPFIAAHLTQQLSPEQDLKLTDLAHNHCPYGAKPLCAKLLDSLYSNEVVRKRFRMAN